MSPLAIKVCGIRRPEDARLALAAGADELGVIFAARSKRRVTLLEARAIRQAIGTAAPLTAVFENPGLAELQEAASSGLFARLQLHGAIPAGAMSLGLPVCVGVHLTGEVGLEALAALSRLPTPPDRLLLDGPRGGSGQSFPWRLARAARSLFPGPIFIAGGLTPENVGQAISIAEPDGVDVASGVEVPAGPQGGSESGDQAGYKDPRRLFFFVQSARDAGRRLQPGAPMDLRHGVPLFVHGPGPLPDARGRFGDFGGRFVPETLIPALEELEVAFGAAREDLLFRDELSRLLADYAGRPTPLYRADRLAASFGIAGAVYLKREDLLHTGAHKLNNTLGQGLLARRMGKPRVIAETGAGQHGVATATVAALFGLECVVYMGAEDVVRQAPNVGRMQLLGAEVRPVHAGSRTLKDAMNEALRDWVTNVRTTYYCIGSAAGPHPYPLLVRELQKVIGEEIALQALAHEGKLPDAVLACVGGGSNAIGAFHRFLGEPGVRLFGVEAGGLGLDSGKHGASMARGRPGILHGSLSYLLQDAEGQVAEAHSVSAGLDYPGVGPELSHLAQTGRLSPLSSTDDEAIAAVSRLARTEGILCALESAHAIAALARLPEPLKQDKGALLVVNLSGRGDKDLATILSRTGLSPTSPGGAP